MAKLHDIPFSAQAVFDGYWELYHDDDCGVTLVTSPSGYPNSYCPVCKFSPDTQSLGARQRMPHVPESKFPEGAEL